MTRASRPWSVFQAARSNPGGFLLLQWWGTGLIAWLGVQNAGLPMRFPLIIGQIKRRLLVNFRVDPATIQALLPRRFRPKLHGGYAIAGICLIRLEHIRPSGFPGWMGISSENAAHRIAVEWDDVDGQPREGVFIPRRDTGSRLNHFAGGRIFPGEHHLASFKVLDDGERIDFAMQAKDRAVAVKLRGFASTVFPASSCFASLTESSAFFEGGSVGFSVTRDPGRLDGLNLKTLGWHVTALEVEQVESSYFSDRLQFPDGTVQFDHALIMRDIAHEWRAVEEIEQTPLAGERSISPAAAGA